MQNSLHGFGIAITRPIDQAKKLSVLIRACAGVAYSFPLINIVELDDYAVFEQKLNQLHHYDWAIFISSNAVQHAMPRLLKCLGEIPKKLKFAAIGPMTAAELCQFGVTNTLIPNGRFDSESLLALHEMQVMQQQKVMIFRGEGGREVLAETLKARGATLDFAECYRRVNPQKNTSVLSELWQKNQLHAIVITSSEAMRHLLDLAQNQMWLRKVNLCVNHARISELPLSLGLKVSVAELPGDDAMMQCIIKALNQS